MGRMIKDQKFRCGQIVATPGAIEKVDIEEMLAALSRHMKGDWGEELCAEDREVNEDALLHGGRLLSVCRTKNGVRFWIITESDRSVTTFLLPEEY